jgi:hypothetical protein
MKMLPRPGIMGSFRDWIYPVQLPLVHGPCASQSNPAVIANYCGLLQC